MAIVRTYIRIGAIAALVVVAGLMLPRIVASREDVRELRIVARDMTYYVAGAPSDEPNPTLRFKAGERVKLVFRNEDTGMSHDFNIDAWDVSTELLNGKGEDVVTFRVPSNTKADRYTCGPHSLMMFGPIVVE